jgi:hypothetical protein
LEIYQIVTGILVPQKMREESIMSTMSHSSNTTMENKFKEGSSVCARANPDLKLVIRRYVDRIYYCKVDEDPLHKELVYFERELEAYKTN